jgi:hypothetical protein
MAKAISPISTRADATTRAQYVANIVATLRRATRDQRTRGMAWYRNAHDFARMLADGTDPALMAGAISALSPQKRWEANVKLARDAVNGHPHGHVADALGKVAKILAGADPAMVLPMSLKTGNFYRCIADSGDPDAVVIDRHAHDVAVGVVYGQANRGLANATRYATLAHCYREAAQVAGILPSQVQAITWIVQTEALAGNGRRPRAGRKTDGGESQ